ncbi:expressed unknown protein [Seminavis robusta]|uniref:Uncharacterized protein n=1 Tax=Seminavis robusta TaxID=568900 RepID=A0A9N8DIM7_9STRA|nr:expressed unknown protein [Seminavis robusta]|eukprot:Sro141_g065810.1 n/a (249) ;mRNA; f:46422-47168
MNNTNQIFQHQPAVATIFEEMKRLNTEGIKSLLEEDSSTAARFFVSALGLAQGQTAVHIPDDEQEPLAVPPRDHRHIPYFSPIRGLQDGDSSVYVHDQPVWLDGWWLAANGDVLEKATTFASFVLFNLALSYHHRGLVEQKAAHLKRACKLYNICASDMIPRLPMSIMESFGVPLAAACLNNQAQIQYQYLGDSAASLRLAHEMLQPEMLARMYAVASQNAQFALQLEEFLLNTQLFLNCSRNAAPVA